MKIFFDTEFYEDGKTIDLISIGLVREDNAELYLESSEADLDRAAKDPWMKENVIKHLTGVKHSRREMKNQIQSFCGLNPTFYAYYCNTDWVAFYQIWGGMLQLPKDYPMYCRDLKYLADIVRFKKEDWISSNYLPPENEHYALADARWNFGLYKIIKKRYNEMAGWANCENSVFDI